MAQLIVNGDIGGTNARMQLWKVGGPNARHEDAALILDKRYSSRDYTGIGPLVRQFLVDAGWPVRHGRNWSLARLLSLLQKL